MISILYVDDETDLLEIAKLFLEQDGHFRVDTTTSASAALTLLTSAHYEAIISDYQMPGMDGIQFLKEVRASGNTIPFIIFTGRGREEIVIEALNEGADFYLQKGGEPEAQYAELTNKIRYAVKRKRAEDTLWKNEVRLHRAEEVAGFGNWEIYLTTNAVTASKGARTLYGLPDEELTIQDIQRVPLPEYRPLLDAALDNLVNNGVPYSVEFKIRREADGKILDIYSLAEYDPGQKTVFGVIHDITDRKKAGEALRESEERYLSLFDRSLDSVYIHDLKGNFIDANPAALALLGYTRDDIPNLAFASLISVDQLGTAQKTIATIVETGSHPGLVEYRLKKKNGEFVEIETKGSLILHGKTPFAVLGVARDITGRKRAEDAQRLSGEALSAMLNGITEAAFLMTPEGIVLAANDTVAQRLGLVRAEDLVGENIFDLLPAEVRTARIAKIREVMQSGQPVQFEDVRSGRVIHQTIYPVKDPDGTVRRLAISGIDITDRKKAGEALRESEERYKNISETTTDFVFSCMKPDGGTYSIDWMAGAVEQITGYTLDDLVARECWRCLVHPDDIPVFDENITNLPEGTSATCILRIRTKNGTEKWIAVNTTHILKKDSSPYYHVYGGCRDITRLKRAEEALRESERGYRDLVENLNDVVFTVDHNGIVTYVSPVAGSKYGYSSSDLPGKPFTDFVFSDDIPALMKRFHEISRGIVVPFEWRLKNKDGSLTWVRTSTRPVPDAQGRNGFFGIISDISKEKTVELALRESEESYRGLFNTVRHAIYIIDGEGKFVDVNDGAVMMYGYAREEFKGRTPEFLSAPGKNDFSRVMEHLRKAFTGEPQQFEFWGLRKNSDVFPKDVRLYKGTYFGRDVIIAIGTDITERKQVEVALNRSRMQLAEAMDQAHLVNWEFDVGTGIFTFNDRFYALYGTTAEIEGGNQMSADVYARKFVHPDDQGIVADEVNKAIQATDPGYESQVEHRIIRRDGEIRHIIVRFGITKDENGRTFKTHGVNQDITERRLVDEALEQSEEKFRLLIENSHDIIYTLTLQGVFTFVSPSWTRLLGHPLTEVVGTSFEEFVHPDDIRRCQEFMQGVIETGQRQTGVEYRVRHADGTWRWHTTNAVPIHDKAGIINGAEGIAGDITRRIEDEVALRQANYKLKLLSGITRHDISNQLMVLAGNLRMLQRQHPDTTRNDNFQKVETAVKRISSMIQFTKEYEEIGVHAPVWQEIRSLVDKAAMQAPLGTVILKNDLPSGTEVLADPLIIKVLFNLMDNAVRYGGKTTAIRFFVKDHDSDHVLVCEDDGTGVPADEKEKIFARGFGKNTGLGLALAREILSITGVTIRETGEPGNGARFEMVVPKEAYRVT